MKKKVAIVVCAWPPGGGGIGNTAYLHAKFLQSDKYQVTAFIPKYHDTRELQTQDYDYEYLPVAFELGKAGIMRGLYGRLICYDIIHLYYPFFGTDLVVYLLKLLHPEKKVILHHQMDPIGDGLKKIIFRLYMATIFPLQLSLSDKIIALSADHAEHSYLTPYYLRHREKFFIVPNMVDTDKFRPQAKNEQLLASLGLRPENQVLMFAGGLDSHHYFKGVDLIINSFASLRQKYPTLKLLIVGDGNWKSRYERQASELGIRSEVIFPGWVPNEDLPQYYNLADVFLLPSTDSTEAFGGVAAEAQCCGVPAVISNWPGSRVTIENNATGLWVEPKNQQDLSKKIDTLLSDDELRAAMGRAAAERAQSMYGAREQVGVRLVEMYDNLYK